MLSGQFELEVSACLALAHALDLRLGKLPDLTDAHQSMNAVEIIVEFRRLPEDEKQKKAAKEFFTEHPELFHKLAQ